MATTMPPATALPHPATARLRVGGHCARRQNALLQGTLRDPECRPRSAAGARCVCARVLALALETRWAAPSQYLGARKKSEHVLCAQRWTRGGGKRTNRQCQSEPLAQRSLSLYRT